VAYKLVAVDIDGTLVDADLLVEPATRRALQQCVKQGVRVTLATGRMFRSALPFAREVGICAPLITYNGALVKDPASGEIYHHRTVPLHLARRVIGLCREMNLQLNVYLDDECYVEEYNGWSQIYEDIAGISTRAIGDLEKFLVREPTKFIIAATPEELDKYTDVLRERLARDLYLTRSRPIFVEIHHPAVSKAEGLRVLGEHYGIELAEMMAVGDADNDVEMLQAAGLGVAMGNAPAKVQKEADWVTASIQEGGLVTALEKFILGDN